MPSPIDGKWKGNNFKALWDHGKPPRSFEVDFTLGPKYAANPTRLMLSGDLVGSGISCGQPFVLKNAQFDTTTQKITFEMLFNGHPPEVFTGKLVGRMENMLYVVSSIEGKVKVHPQWLMEKPYQVKSQYGRYYATVSLKKA